MFQAALTASQVADLPVLILGETGTGKQRLAEAVHKLDPRIPPLRQRLEDLEPHAQFFLERPASPGLAE